MAHEQEESQYPQDSNSYKILNEIGVSFSSIVYKAKCEPINSTIVAIKSIDLDQSCTDFNNIRRETILSHPNILNPHCSFTVDRRLWIVMPFMSGGSLQSIITSSFPSGLSEPCIAIVLKETLNALSYLHNQGHLHRDVKGGNILIDSNGAIKLAASLYDGVDVAGTPYWMAPEVIHSHSEYSFKADIWSFGVTALELAHGIRPPLSHLPPSKSLLMKIMKRFWLSDYDKSKNDNGMEFSKDFKDMVASCLDQDPSKRPSAENLLNHSFFKNCNDEGADFLVKKVLLGLPSVEERFKECKIGDITNNDEEEDRRIIGWKFNEDGFKLDPVYPNDDSIVKQVRFGGETIIQDKRIDSGGSGESSLSMLARVGEVGLGGAHSEYGSGSSGIISSSIEGVIGVGVGVGGGGGGGVDRDMVVDGLALLRRSLDDQRQKVTNLMGMLGEDEGNSSRELTREEKKMVHVIEKLRIDLENQKKKNFELEVELEFLKFQISGTSNSGGGGGGGGTD